MNPNHAQLPSWMFRLVARRPVPSSRLLQTRIEVCPPELFPSSLTWSGRLQRLRNRWLQQAAPWLPVAVRPVNRLALVKREFHDSLSDLNRPSAFALLEQIERARSLRELWHLRSPVYGEVAVATTQTEAELRLTRLNRHFPVRAPRSTAPAQAA